MPKAFANFSPGWSLRSNPGIKKNDGQTLKGFANCGTLSGFKAKVDSYSQGCRYAPTLG